MANPIVLLQKLATSLGAFTGSVQFFPLSSAPSGFLEADGSTVSRTTYASLYAVIGDTFGSGDGSTTFTLPDYRGEFIRGWDNGRGVDDSRVLGSSQLDAFQGHQHFDGNIYSASLNDGDFDAGSENGRELMTNSAGTYDAGYGTPRIDTETRPRNVALLACIKY